MSYKRKVCFAIAIGFLLSAVVIGSCLAYFLHTNENVDKLKVGSNYSQIINTFDEDNLPENITKGTVVPMRISVLNAGSPAYVRIFMAISDSSIAEKMTIDYNIKDYTKIKIDGEYWWYYNKAVSTNGINSTKDLCTKVTFNEDLTAKERENLEIIIYEETVQARGFDTPAEAFKSIKGE